MTENNGTGSTEKLLIKRLKVSGLLSFGPTGIDLPMRGLNVLIGANGSGKSNLIEIFSLLRSAARGQFGGEGDWLWKGEGDHTSAEGTVEITVSNPKGSRDLRHVLTVFASGLRLDVADERIEDVGAEVEDSGAHRHYDYKRGDVHLFSALGAGTRFMAGKVHPDRSILTQVRDPENYPALASLERAYDGFRLFRNWQFGPTASLRQPQSVSLRDDFLAEDGCDNLAMVLSNLPGKAKSQLTESLKKLYEGIDRISPQKVGAAIQLFLREAGDRQIRATRLSDGTLRYLCLLAILLHPDPPPFVAIEEPELGLHPDVIQHVATLLIDASRRTQLVVTTHSRRLIDELGDLPDSVVVCEKHDGESTFERLDGERMKHWLDRYTLGELWSSGELGGNRW
ncbi:MAG TPA: AAA family ATPase [Bryobacteraceae bacterium]